MSNRLGPPSYTRTERIGSDFHRDQLGSHQTSATQDTSLAPMAAVTFNTHNPSGPVTNINGNIYYENSATAAPDNLDIHIDHAARARFDCKGRTACTERTRIDVIEKIETWTDTGPPVFWLNGSAGTGKSTIAFTVAKSFKERGILGASFFCSRDDATCSNHKLIFPTIAFQLAHFHFGFRRRLAEVMKELPDIIHSDVAYQLQELIVKPLATMQDLAHRCVIVIDALDECKDGSTVSAILSALSRHVEILSPLKIFLTSRPEHSINLGFGESVLQAATRNLVLHKIKRSEVEADIKTYLTSHLELVRSENHIAKPWPSDAEIDSLSKLSWGLFIFAATSIKFIQDRNYHDPQGQLGRIIRNEMLNNDRSDPRHRLDQLYLQVLTNAHPKPSFEMAERLRLILGTIVLLQDPLCLHGIQQLLKQQPGTCFNVQAMRHTLMRLHSIILVPEGDNDIIRTLHPSFFDFITNPDRCSISQLLVDTSQQHTLLLTACLRTMQGLKRNVCELPEPSVLNNEVADLSARIVEFIPAELEYACRHWGTHLRYAVISEDIWTLLRQFCSKHMLFWVEACSLLGDLRNQLIILDAVQRTLLKRVDLDPTTKMLLNDCEHFIREFFPVISASWADVYDSALLFTPPESQLYRCFSSQLPQTKVMRGPQKLNACSRIIEGHSGWIHSVAFSPNGSRVASGSEDRTIRLWDTVSGVHLNTLEGHSSSVTSVAFSSVGSTIVSGSDDCTARMWDVASGALLARLEHPHGVKLVAFTSDATTIISCDTNLTLRQWDVVSRVLMRTIKTGGSRSQPIDNFRAVALSTDGARFVDATSNRLQIWNTVDGKCINTLTARSKPSYIVAISPNGTSIASASAATSTIRVWDAISGKYQMSLKRNSEHLISLAFSPDGARIMGAFQDETIELWDAFSGANLPTLNGSSDYAASIASSPDGTSIVAGSLDHTIRMWIIRHDLHPESATWNFPLFLSALSPHNANRSSLSESAHFSNKHSRNLDEQSKLRLVLFSPDGVVVISVSLDGPPILWDAASGAHLMTLKGHSDRVNMAAFSHDGTRILSASDDKRVRIWDTVTGVTVKTLKGHRKSVLSVTFSHDSTRIASGSEDGTTRLWDASTGAHTQTLQMRNSDVRGATVAFSPTDSTQIACVFDGCIQLWNTLTGTHLKTFKMGESFLRSMAFSPDGECIVMATRKGALGNDLNNLELWDLLDGGKLKAIKSHEDSPALWLPFSPDYPDLATDDEAREWAQASGTNAKHHYFLQHGWVWLAHPRRRLCWVPVTCRGPSMFASGNARIAFGTNSRGLVIIDFSKVLDRYRQFLVVQFAVG